MSGDPTLGDAKADRGSGGDSPQQSRKVPRRLCPPLSHLSVKLA